MRFFDVLNVLSKSSPYAVSTEKQASFSQKLDGIKDYLYIETQIEKDFRGLLNQSSEKKIIFLCGSSGDGKSEIMTRYSQDPIYSHIDFHLDATHSFNPRLDAIATLDKIFDVYKAANRTLAIGINLGMMAKYANMGSERHSDIKDAMLSHTQKSKVSGNIDFLSFEDHKYAKFLFKDGKPYSDFASNFMLKLTNPSSEQQINPIWEAMLAAKATNESPNIVTNFILLSMESVQTTIIELLMKARLAKDQFVTARAFLDFIYTLLVNDAFLFDSLFLSKNNELTDKLASFDPALLRSEKLDNLALTLKLNLPEDDLSKFKVHLKDIGIDSLYSSASHIRLFYALRYASLGNDYHLKYATEFDDKLLTDYSNVLLAHQNYKGESNEHEKSVINNFYKHVLFTALWRYINRAAPQLKNKQFVVAKENTVLFATELKLLIDWPAIESYESKDLMSFSTFIKVNKNSLESVMPVNINLFELLQRLNQGYRPNKYDKNCVLLLDELVEQLKSEMAKSDTLIIIDEKVSYEAENDDGLIEITER